jgi:hypothetical protein
MTKKLLMLGLLYVIVLSVSAYADSTIATFADPTVNGFPLFTANLGSNIFNGGWSDALNGLTLQVPFKSHTFTNAWFDMTPLTLSANVPGYIYNTGGGSINFYADHGTTPLLTFTFDKGMLSPFFGMSSNETLVLANVTITGSEITSPVVREQFSFSFANLAPLSGNFDNGFTSSGSFTSSAVVPEPATIGLLSIGALSIFKKRKH